MSITLEKIDSIRERLNVSYSEAREALQLHDGDLIEALAYLEKQRTQIVYKPEVKNDNEENSSENYSEFKESFKSILDTIKNLLCKGFEIRLLVSKHERIKLDMAINLLIVALVFAFPFTLIAGAIGLLTNHRFSIRSNKEDNVVNPNGGLHVKDIINIPKYHN